MPFISTQAPAATAVPSTKTTVITTFQTWTPNQEENAKISSWFMELDKDRTGFIGGVDAVAFMKRSNLQKEDLREIWALVDSSKRGKLDRDQFVTVVRFLSVLCDATYRGRKPSVELYNSAVQNLYVKTIVELLSNDGSAPVVVPNQVPSGSAAVADKADAISSSFVVEVDDAPLPTLASLNQVAPAPASITSVPGAYNSQFPSHAAQHYPPGTYPPHHHGAALAPATFPGNMLHLYTGNDQRFPQEDEEFSEFTDAHVANPAIPDLQAVEVAEDEFEEFTDFSSGPLHSTLIAADTPSMTPFASVVPPLATSSTKTVQVEDVDDDFGDFSDIHMKGEPTVLPEPVATTTSLDVDDPFAKLVNAPNIIPELKFAPSTSTEPPKPVPSNMEFEDGDNFSDFASVATITNIVPSTDLSSAERDESDPFGALMNSETTLMKDEVTLADIPTTADTKVKASLDFDDIFGDLTSEISPDPQLSPVMSMGEPIALKSSATEFETTFATADEHDWDDFAGPSGESISSKVDSSNITPSVINRTLDTPQDPFADITPEPESSAATTNMNIEEDDIDNDFGEFADFEGSSSKSGKLAVAAPVFSIQNPVSLAKQDEGDDFGNFGDFESHTPISPQTSEPTIAVPTMAQTQVKSNLLDFDLLDTGTENFTSTVTSAPPMKASVSTAAMDLLSMDFLEPSPYVVASQPSTGFAAFPNDIPSAQQSTSQAIVEVSTDDPFGPSHEVDDFDDFEADFQTAFTPNPISPPTAPALVAFDVSFDSFGSSSQPSTLPSAPAAATTSSGKQSIPGIVASSENNSSTPASSSSSKQAHFSVAPPSISVPSPQISPKKMPTAKPLSFEELCKLSEVLGSKHWYDDAFACAVQALNVHKLQDLMAKKQQALEQDDLELAMKIKNESTEIAKTMETADQENEWLALSKTNSKGQSLGEMYEAIGLFNETFAKQFHMRFMKSIPSKPPSSWSMHLNSNNTNMNPLVTFIEYVKFFVLAKRTSRLLVALSSSHTQQADVWKKLLDQCERLLIEANNNLLYFLKLKSMDQNAVKTEEKFKSYVEAVIMIIESSIMIAASCSEAYVNENEAKKVFQLSMEVLKLMKKEWSINSEVGK